jgi:acetyl esterase
MALVPQAQAICDATNAMQPIVLCDDTIAEQRLSYGMLLMMAGEPEPVFHVEDRQADGVPVRIFRPSPSPDLPVVVHIHGGGWTIGNVEQYDPIARQIANATNAIVVSVDYRLAPEYPYPAGLDDCWTALLWTAKNASTFGGDPARLAIIGDSAGGNHAAVCALLARDAGAPDVALQVLVYPVTDCMFDTKSYSQNGEGYLLDTKQMHWFFDCYTRGGCDPSDWHISPLRAPDVARVAPAFVITCEFDPLRDEGEAYAGRLEKAGVPVSSYRYDGMIHGFFGLSAAFDASRDAMHRVGTEVRRAFGTLDA